MPLSGLACTVQPPKQFRRPIRGGALLASKVRQERTLRNQAGFELFDAHGESLAVGCARLGHAGCLVNARRKLTQFTLTG